MPSVRRRVVRVGPVHRGVSKADMEAERPKPRASRAETQRRWPASIRLPPVSASSTFLYHLYGVCISGPL